MKYVIIKTVNGLLDKDSDYVLTTNKRLLNDVFEDLISRANEDISKDLINSYKEDFEDFVNNPNRTLFTANVINKHDELLGLSIVVDPFEE
jgi:hypothetical protein